MPIYLDKKTGRLYIEFQYKGTRYKERLPRHTRRSDAEKLEIKIKNDLMFQSHGIATKTTDISFERFLREYFGPHIESHYSTASFEKAVHICKAALPFFKGKPMRSIKPADVERFKVSRMNLPTLHRRPRKPATVLREISIISRVFSLAVQNDLVDYNPCSRIEKPKFDNIQDRILRREDEAAFFANMHSEWAKDICKLVLNTGLRQNDVMNLTRFEVDLDARLIRLVQGKTKRRVMIALNDEAMEILSRRIDKGERLLFPSPVTGKETGSVRHAMLRACDRAKIPPVTIRDLRRTFATRGLEEGNDAYTVADALGHSSMRMIPRYVRSVENKRKLVESLSGSPKTPPVSIKRKR